ncbi:MAG: ABC transporter ATP-binding protein [Streptosporangiaceae bacterium]
MTTPGEPLVMLDGVTFRYSGPPPVLAVRSARLRLAVGEHIALTGASGSGKSTLLNLMGLLDRPVAGRVLIDGADLSAAPESARAAVRARRIGFVFQTFQLLPNRTAAENVMLGQVYAGVPRARRLRLAMDALDRVGLARRVWALPTQLSGGERQRVAVARAVVNRPALLLCDEPTGNLDSAATAQLLDLLDELHAGGMTMVTVTHNPVVAARASRRVIIRDGVLTEAATAGDGPGADPQAP